MRIGVLAFTGLLAIAAAAAQSLPEKLIEAGHWKKARAIVESRDREDPKDALSNFLLSQIRNAFGDRESPLVFAEKAVSLDGGVAKYHRQIAEVLGVKAQHSGMVQQLFLARRFRKEIDTAIALDAADLQALRDLMEFYLLAPGIAGGDRAKAADIADRIARVDPAEGFSAKARLAAFQGDRGQVEGLLRKALEKDPGRYRSRIALANFYAASDAGNPAAVEQARQAVTLDPGRVDAYAILARAYAARGQWAELDSILTAAEKEVPDDLAPFYRAAEAILESDRSVERAADYLRKYLAGEPEGNAPTLSEARGKLTLALDKHRRDSYLMRNRMPTSDAAAPESPRLKDQDLFCNRELSLLSFQKRVLAEAMDPANPLLERINFLSIFGSNLDEFFMVRVAVLKQRSSAGAHEVGVDGLTETELLEAIRAEVVDLTGQAYTCLRDSIRPALEQAGIRLLEYADLDAAARASLDEYFSQTVFPVLTPLAFDPGRPFPHISNLSLNLAVVVKDAAGVEHFARVKVPNTLPQLVPVPSLDLGFVWLEQVIIPNLQALFPGLDVVEAHPFHVTRDAEVAIQELESDDLLETIEEAVWRRRFRAVVRLQLDKSIPPHIQRILTEEMEVDPRDLYHVDGPMDLSRLRQLHGLDRPDLKYKPLAPFTPPDLQPKSKDDIFALIRREDILLHHPFESFQPVVEFIRSAARDPAVLAIKMTLYRVGRNSPIVEALLNAIEEGKQVSVLLELKARFDEESNIEWARALEREGVHVIYGLLGLKVHSKIALVVRQEGDVMRRYVHLGTGNYNPQTARLYTDFSLFTCDEQTGADATDLFNYLTGYSAKNEYRRLLVAPISMRKRMEHLIQREIELASRGEKGYLIFKMNALEDPEMIKLLYRASQSGVQIDLLVRGLCCLRPGVAGVSENVRVISVIGRFLEHSRIYYFRNGGQEELYMGSADLMPRNLNRRVEIITPVAEPRLLRRMRDEILGTYLADTVNAHRMQSDGTYVRSGRSRSTGGVDSHIALRWDML